ncbi:hypothetical protein [Limobrevibacterium gyesilva]|uniref:hypothetical protein n=1 Tax=Limobrevibacterium gyesilva TaxID=2991712 RepID=UPI00222607FC|nr:hypothetical protein [Limobrevibacterium gyesilva]
MRIAAAASPANRVEVAEAALKAEREARERAERSLQEAQAAIHDLRTKLGHAVLARDEARDAAHRAESDRRAVEFALAAERDARVKAEKVLQGGDADREPAQQRLREIKAVVRPAKAPVKAVAGGPAAAEKESWMSNVSNGKTRSKSPEPEPKPVRWWIKAKAQKRATT